jgi:hypothetical protein
VKLSLPNVKVLLGSIVAVLSVVVFTTLTATELEAASGGKVRISSNVTGGDIEANSTYVVVVYHSAAVNGQGFVYIKSSTESEGWLTSTGLGFGSQTRVALDPNNANKAYVVWKDSSTSPEKIKYARCTLAATVSPSCTSGTIFSAASNQTLQSTDIVVGGDGSIHVVWENLTTHTILTAQATTGNLSSWPIAFVNNLGSQDGRPVLAWSNNSVHLAFLRGNLSTEPTQIVYLRTDKGALGGYHDWNSPEATKTFARNAQFSESYDYIASRPSLAASGNNIYLAWDAFSSSLTNTPQKHFGLMRASSSNKGTNLSWSAASLITSDADPLEDPLPPSAANKYSYLLGPPQEQIALRPSLVISGTGFALVWQASPDASGCHSIGSGASTANAVHFAVNNGASWTLEETLTPNKTSHTSNIAPDLAIPSGGPPSGTQGHFIYMQDPTTTTLCAGGNYPEYTLYYFGPFVKTDLDRGNPGVYLPFIRR